MNLTVIDEQFHAGLRKTRCKGFGHTHRRDLQNGARLFIGNLRHVGLLPIPSVPSSIFLDMQSAGEDFAGFVWGIAGGRPIQNTGAVPSSTPLLEEMSKALKKRGFKFVGPVIVYAWMQAVGIVNDHSAGRFQTESRGKSGKTG